MATRIRKTMLSNPLDDIKGSKNKAKTTAGVEKAIKRVDAKSTGKKLKTSIRTATAKDGQETSGMTDNSPARVANTIRRRKPEVATMRASPPGKPDAVDDRAAAILDDSKIVVESQPVPTQSDGVAVIDTSEVTAEKLFELELKKTIFDLEDLQSRRKKDSQHVVRRYSQWSIPVGLIPVPVLDIAVLSALQVKMIRDLCQVYGIDFDHRFAFAVVTGLAGSSIAKVLGTYSTRQVAQYVPGVGTVFQFVIEPTLSYATTFAIGTAFIYHFDAGGKLDSFDPVAIKLYFDQQVSKGVSRFKGIKQSQ